MDSTLNFSYVLGNFSYLYALSCVYTHLQMFLYVTDCIYIELNMS